MLVVARMPLPFGRDNRVQAKFFRSFIGPCVSCALALSLSSSLTTALLLFDSIINFSASVSFNEVNDGDKTNNGTEKRSCVVFNESVGWQEYKYINKQFFEELE